MKRPELLSPAGNMESLVAAIMAGADAIYVGGKNFGARSFAQNFTNEELLTALHTCHLYGVKLYVTANTLIHESEVDEFISYMKYLHKIGIDAVIMQDIGMIDLVRKVLPNFEIHASTQLHIHNLSGTKLVESLGLKRVVLARETSINDIKTIKENTNIELEIFIHGALCISYSGQCLMSSLIGGRSGNRGVCAGSCRLPYDLVDENNNVINKDKYLLSTKDLNSLENIGSLIDIGVDSFKIEGRMKSPAYVYTVVSLYRKAIDSYLRYKEVRINNNDLTNLKKIFNREFTKGFLFNDNNANIVNQYRPNHLGVPIGTVIDYKKNIVTIKLTDYLHVGDGIRIVGTKDTGLTVTTLFKNNKKIEQGNNKDIVSFKIEDHIKIGSQVLKTTDILLLKEIDKKIKDSNRKVNIKMQIKLRINEPIKLKVKDETHIIIKELGMVTKAINAPISKDKVIEQITKVGNTIYNVEDIIIKMDDNIFVNIKDLNEIRRIALEELNNARLEVKPYIEGKYSIDLIDYPVSNNIDAKITNIDIYNKLEKKYNKIYTDDIDTYKKLNNKVIYMLPRVISNYPNIDSEVQVEELGGIKEYSSFSTGSFLNVYNSYSLAFLHSMGSSKVTLSTELSFDRVEDIISAYHKRYNKHPNVEVIVFGRIEAMISKFNLLNKFNISGNYYLKDKFNNKYPIRIKDDKMIIYNYKNIYLKDDYFSIGVNNIRYDFNNINDLDEIK